MARSDFTLSRTTSSLPCPSCAVNITTGIKTCPINGETLLINPAEQVCSSQFFCDNPLLPYAVLTDGSTDFSGTCENNVACSCVNKQFCPSYIATAFSTTNGDPYNQPQGQRLSFSQIEGDGENISFLNSTTFCQIPYAWLPFGICPNMTCFSGNNCDLTGQLQECMNLIFTTSNPVINPCLQGKLALLLGETENLPILTDDYLLTASYGCVITPQECPLDSISVYSTQVKQILCLPPA
jgi:hypothetical protein